MMEAEEAMNVVVTTNNPPITIQDVSHIQDVNHDNPVDLDLVCV